MGNLCMRVHETNSNVSSLYYETFFFLQYSSILNKWNAYICRFVCSSFNLTVHLNFLFWSIIDSKSWINTSIVQWILLSWSFLKRMRYFYFLPNFDMFQCFTMRYKVITSPDIFIGEMNYRTSQCIVEQMLRHLLLL